MVPKEGFNEQLLAIQEKAKQLSFLKNNKTELFNQIDNLPSDIVEAMEDRYKNTREPINTLRKNAADFILRGNSMTDEFIESEKSEQKIIHGEGVFRLYKNPFSIFYPFILLHKNQPNERELLIAFSSEICNRLGLSTDEVKIKIVDFTGSNNLGADWVWFAIYNATHKNQRTAKQLFFALSSEGIFYSFYNRIENKHSDEVTITINEFNFDNLLKTYSKYINSIKKDSFKDQIVVKTPNIYKISHGVDVITNEQYRQLLERNLIIVHSDTPPLGKRYETQYDDFEIAKNGSLFYLCRSNQEIVLIGKLIGEAETCEVEPLGKEGWMQRKYELVAEAKSNKGYTRNEGAWWLPNFRSTFYQIPERDFEKLDKEILLPFFGLDITSLYEIEIKTGDTPQNPTQKEREIAPFEMTDGNVAPILDIHKITKPLAAIIRMMNDESGQMIGIFGSWGRGKTFFIKELLKQEFKIDYEKESDLIDKKIKRNLQVTSDIKPSSETTFYFTKFHAWKYQDTEGVWAYLYQTIAEKYFTHRNLTSWDEDNLPRRTKLFYSFKKWVNEKKLLFRLNVERNGYLDFMIFFGLLFLMLSGCITMYLDPKGESIPGGFFTLFSKGESNIKSYFTTTISSISVATGLAFINFIRKGYKLGDRGKRLIQKYTHKPTFNKLLGVQAEIHIELKHLMKAWIKESETSKKETNNKNPHQKKRLILFVDDIDRCNQDKIIGIVDALRVILEDEEIAKRMIIIMAVDEEKLESAIIHKYAHLMELTASFNSEEKLPPLKRMETTINEYMDKLFISGIKLPVLSQNEVKSVLVNYAVLFNYERNPIEIEDGLIDDSLDKDWDNLLANIDDELDEYSEELINTATNKMKVYEYELECIESQNNGKSKTPRQLRIILYRFLVAQLIIDEYKITPTKELKIYLAKTIATKTSKQDETHEFPEILINSKPTIDKIINMVVPY